MNYPKGKRPYRDYLAALARRWPIATGVIERAHGTIKPAARQDTASPLDRRSPFRGPAPHLYSGSFTDAFQELYSSLLSEPVRLLRNLCRRGIP
ncbi:hypothetical protein [Streptomyces sp. AC550_RSS872]|uniref:hypothetical protein n=1 Tax=Streptomyces sp. AC550_RSS872 TaxID=2823689 RepID=UPI001C25D8BD|nr:hypothetical protein [Streptomyces sp. AC550_RSS872]